MNCCPKGGQQRLNKEGATSENSAHNPRLEIMITGGKLQKYWFYYFSFRWEMKKDETLEETEKMMLDHLKQICSIQDSSALDSTVGDRQKTATALF